MTIIIHFKSCLVNFLKIHGNSGQFLHFINYFYLKRV